MPVIMGGKSKESKSITVIEPDKVQAVTTTVPMFAVEEDEFKSGLIVWRVYVKTSSSPASATSLVVNSYSDPTDTPTYVCSVEMESVDEVDYVPNVVSGSINTSEIIAIEVPNVDVDWMHVTVFFSEN